MTGTPSREIWLKDYPIGVPTAQNFELVNVTVPDPAPGQCLVRNIWMSVDPYMRGRMRPGISFVPAFEPGQPLEGGCIGQVVASHNGPFSVGDYVQSEKGWRDYWLTDGRNVDRINPQLAPLPTFLGALGMPGFTAYVGLLRIGEIKPHETVFVSAAAGAVGSIACQIAHLKECHVIASVGTDEKAAWLKDDLGIDLVFNYLHVSSISDGLTACCPGGIDVYFDNVGGQHLDAAIQHLARFGRVVACGMISQYNDESPPPGPVSIYRIVPNRLRIQGFIVFDHIDLRPAFEADMSRWLHEGLIKTRETVVEGLENAPTAFTGLFRGQNIGKMLVKISPDSAV